MIKLNLHIQNDADDVLQLLYRGLQDMYPAMRAVAGTMQSAVDQNFASGGRPKWLGVKRGGSPLIDKGTLRNSIQAQSDSQSATVGTNLVYAPIHHFGGKTKPHKITPRYRRALAFGGGVYKSVNHPGSRIPARPFLCLTAQDEDDVVDDLQSYFRQLVK